MIMPAEMMPNGPNIDIPTKIKPMMATVLNLPQFSHLSLVLSFFTVQEMKHIATAMHTKNINIMISAAFLIT